MIIAVSGYNESGKTTLAKRLAAELQAHGQPLYPVRFDSLYLSRRLGRRDKNCEIDPDEAGTLGLRRLEGQKGGWDQRFGWRQFIDITWAAATVRWLRLLHPRRVYIFDRYFYDRFIHYQPRGWLYRTALWLIPPADLAFILLPENKVWEQRMLARLRRKFSISLEQLSDQDRAELQLVRDRYTSFLRADTKLIEVDSAQPGAGDAAAQQVLQHLRHQLA